MPFTYINGQYKHSSHANSSAADRGFIFSDGVYEVSAYKNNEWIDWDWHIERLHHSLKALEIPPPISDASLKIIANNMMKRHHLNDGYIYLQITRGAAPRKHSFPRPPVKPTLMMTAHRWPSYPNSFYQEGVNLITTEDIRWGRRDIKSISLLPNILAAEKAASLNATEALLIDGDIVTECSASNIFIVTAKGVLQTHPANQRILGGITRKAVLNLASTLNIPLEEKAFALQELTKASEVFITSTTRGVMPVKMIDATRYKLGPITQKLMRAYDLS